MQQEAIAIIGSGKVATVLAKRLMAAGLGPEVIVSRNRISGAILAEKCRCRFIPADEIPANSRFDMAVLCVPDSQIVPAATVLRHHTQSLVHVSGSMPLAALGPGDHGVWYPLMTFAGTRSALQAEIPFFIETHSLSLKARLEILTVQIAAEVRYADSEKRRKLHLAAVFANNFPVAMVRAARYLADEQGVEWDDLKNLVMATFQNLITFDPDDLQTGPAARHDAETLETQLRMLGQDPLLQDVYRAISAFIESRAD